MAERRDWKARRLHFIGVGGAGMSGLALVCARLGATVSGSDRSDSSYMERLRAAGLGVTVGHDAANLPDGAEVVVSTAIGAENPELIAARARGAEPIHRGALLAELCAEKRLIAVAGTHGKTTTTAMIATALRATGADPAFFVGGEVPGLGADGGAANAGWGEGEWVVAEADESDASFLELRPEVAVVTNLEMDHHSRWGSLAELHAAFRRFVAPASGAALPADGSLDGLVGCGERRGSSASTPSVRDRSGSSWRCPVSTTGRTRGRRSPRSSSPGSTSTARRRRSARSPGCGGGSSARGVAAASPYMTTTPTTRPRSAPRSAPCASSSRRACLPSSSRTSTRGPRRWRRSSGRRWRSPTRSRCSTSTRRASSRSASWPG